MIEQIITEEAEHIVDGMKERVRGLFERDDERDISITETLMHGSYRDIAEAYEDEGAEEQWPNSRVTVHIYGLIGIASVLAELYNKRAGNKEETYPELIERSLGDDYRLNHIVLQQVYSYASLIRKNQESIAERLLDQHTLNGFQRHYLEKYHAAVRVELKALEALKTNYERGMARNVANIDDIECPDAILINHLEDKRAAIDAKLVL